MIVKVKKMNPNDVMERDIRETFKNITGYNSEIYVFHFMNNEDYKPLLDKIRLQDDIKFSSRHLGGFILKVLFDTVPDIMEGKLFEVADKFNGETHYTSWHEDYKYGIEPIQYWYVYDSSPNVWIFYATFGFIKKDVK